MAEGKYRVFSEGSKLTVQGRADDNRCLYLLLSGKCTVALDGFCIAVLEKGSVVGEASLFSDAPSGATVTAKDGVVCFSIPHKRLRALLEVDLELRTAVQGIIFEAQAAKLQAMNMRAAKAL